MAYRTNTRSPIFNTGTRSSAQTKTANYSMNARSTMAPRKTSYSLDLRKSTPYNTGARTASYQAASSNNLSKPTATTTYQVVSSNSTSPNQTTYGTGANSVGTRQLEYGIPSVTLDFDTIAKLIAPQQVIYDMSTAVINNKTATSGTTRPQMPAFNITAESTAKIPSPRPPDPQVPTSNGVSGQSAAQKEAPSMTTRSSGCQILAAFSTGAKSTASTKPSSFQTASKTSQMPTSSRLATPKSAGANNVFVKTRPNTVVRADLIKNKPTTKRTEPVNSVSRAKDDEYKAGKKPKLGFKTKLVNKYCTYYHKYGRCKEGNFCAYKHDPNRVEVCKLWLKGFECTSEDKCPLQHVESARLIPHCRHFCKGMCLKDDCHYTHVKVSKRASHCKDFMVGRYCPAGTDCRKKHEWGLYEEPTETESEKRAQDSTEEEVERENIKKLREEMANGVNPFAAGWTFIPIDD